MKWFQCSTSSVIGLVSLGLLAGCEEGPVSPDRAPASAAVSAAGRGERHIVLLKQGIVSATALGVEVARLGGRIERSHARSGVLQVRDLTAAAAARLAARPEVEAVARDRRVQWLPPSEQRIHRLQPLGPSTQSNQRDAAFFDRFQWNIKRIKAPQAWDVSAQGAGVTVCILDTGVDPRHIDLEGRLDSDLSASFVGSERADRDFNFHGTAMASIVATNGIGIASVASDASLCSVKVLDRSGSGTFGDVIAGIDYVGDAGEVDGGSRVSVANMSLGALLPKNDPEVRALVRATQRAINSSTSQGVLFVASAGNSAADLNDPDLIHLPSQLDNVISVGATGPINQRRFDHIASYSNVGRRGVDVFAPGGEFAFPENVIEDVILHACSPSIREPGFEVCAERDVYVFAAGTSPAAAHVSGEAAVIESELAGDQTPAQLTACILRNADPLPNPLLTANGRINVLRGQECVRR